MPIQSVIQSVIIGPTIGLASAAPAGGESALLLESGDYLLLESGDKLLLE
jgi:hypothetical protein